MKKKSVTRKKKEKRDVFYDVSGVTSVMRGTSKERKTAHETALRPIITLPEKLEEVLVAGNLANLQPAERVQYYNAVCKSIGLNPLTKPFEYIQLSGKLTLYARKDATDQLRKMYGVSVYDYRTEKADNVFIYTAFLQDASGRKDIGTGIVMVGGKHGDDLANAMMKAETKAKRRGTLSICGLGMLDESELETIAGLPQPKVKDVTPTAQDEYVDPSEPLKVTLAATDPAPSQSTYNEHQNRVILVRDSFQWENPPQLKAVNNALNSVTTAQAADKLIDLIESFKLKAKEIF